MAEAGATGGLTDEGGRRALELRQIELDNLRSDMERERARAEGGLIARQELESAQRLYDEAALQVRIARERLQLLEDGRIRGARTSASFPSGWSPS